MLKKTKLGETDLIITGFSEEGVQIRAVAKGARRPGSKLGPHLELFSIVRVLFYQKSQLGIIKEASTVSCNEACRCDVVHSAGAAIIVELLDRVSAEGDKEARLFPLLSEALRCLGEVPGEGVALIAAAAALKTASQLGYRPSLHECVSCGSPVGGSEGLSADMHTRVQDMLYFSFEGGGVVCENCLSEPTRQACTAIGRQIIDWASVLISSRFVDLKAYADSAHEALGRALLEFTREWIRFHLVRHLKSLDFLLSFR